MCESETTLIRKGGNFGRHGGTIRNGVERSLFEFWEQWLTMFAWVSAFLYSQLRAHLPRDGLNLFKVRKILLWFSVQRSTLKTGFYTWIGRLHNSDLKIYWKNALRSLETVAKQVVRARDSIVLDLMPFPPIVSPTTMVGPWQVTN